MSGIKNLDVHVTGTHLSYRSYPLKFPRIDELRSIPASEIELISADYSDYELLLRNGSVVFFPSEKEIALREFVRRHEIPVIHGANVWDLLTEPFLDTEIAENFKQLTIDRLSRFGFDREEVEVIRGKIGPTMLEYNAVLWEWVALGLMDVLHAHNNASEEFSRWVFSISARGYRQGRPIDLTSKRDDKDRNRWLDGRLSSLCHWDKLREPGHKAPADLRPRIAAQEALLADLLQRYSEPQRRYHNVNHLQQVISLLSSFGPRLTAPAMLAGWFHDIVYIPESKDNEAQSAEVMEPLIQPLEPAAGVVKRARELILYTTTHLPTNDPEEQMVHDADLGIFGLDRQLYAKYASDIRQEYAFVPESDFKRGRAEILERFLRQAQQQGHWFYGLDPILEENVEGNLEWELALLRR